MKPIIQFPRIGEPMVSYPVGTVAAHYGIPTIAKQTQWVSVISLGGGVALSDLKQACDAAGHETPPLRFISVDGATNDFTGDPSGPDGENALDVQTIALATKGKVGILFYSAKNEGPSFARGVRQSGVDNVACAGSCSWGQAEGGYPAADRASMDDAGKFCASLGIPWTAASGDAGSGDSLPGNNVDYPSASPYFLGVGGTSWKSSGESAWSYGGGGLSRLYARPTWQLIGGTARGVPDWAANSDPNTGYQIIVGGKSGVVGGTSAAAPLFAAGIAACVSNTGKRFMNLAALLYTLRPDFTDITVGSNGAFKAVSGWDPTTGLGVPNAALWQALMASQGTVTPPPTPNPPPTGTRIVVPVAGTYQLVAA